MKRKIIKLSIAALIIIGICLFILFAIKEHFYHSAYSIATSNSRSVAYILDDLLNKTEDSLKEYHRLEGYCSHDKVIITNVDDENKTIEYLEEGTDMGSCLYWTAKITDSEIIVWSCLNSVIEESKCIPYSYGEQKDILSIFQKQMIGYYCLKDENLSTIKSNPNQLSSQPSS